MAFLDFYLNVLFLLLTKIKLNNKLRFRRFKRLIKFKTGLMMSKELSSMLSSTGTINGD